MTTFETADSPLDFAYIAAKSSRFPDPDLLREVALQYGETKDGLDKAVAILREASSHRRLFGDGVTPQGEVFDFRTLAVDFHNLGRHNVAMAILEKAIRFTRRLPKRKWRIAALAFLVDECHCIGEYERRGELLGEVGEYLKTRRRFGACELNDRWAYELFKGYLSWGMAEDAEVLAGKMSGYQRVEALALLSFHDQPKGQCRESLLSAALKLARKHGLSGSLALIAGLMARNGQAGRAKILTGWTVNSYNGVVATFDLALIMLLEEDTAGALEYIDELLESRSSYVEFHYSRISQLCSLLQDKHGDVLRRVLNHVRQEVTAPRIESKRLEGLAKLVGLIAPCSRDEAEELVSQLLNTCLAKLELPTEKAIIDFHWLVPGILHALSMAIERHGLDWTEERKGMYRLLLGPNRPRSEAWLSSVKHGE